MFTLKALLYIICPDYDSPGDQLLAHILTSNGGTLVSLGQCPGLVRRGSAQVNRLGPVPCP